MTLTVQQMLAAAEAVVPRISADEAKGLVGRADVVFLDAVSYTHLRAHET